jgi:hypothetical protein
MLASKIHKRQIVKVVLINLPEVTVSRDKYVRNDGLLYQICSPMTPFFRHRDVILVVTLTLLTSQL